MAFLKAFYQFNSNDLLDIPSIPSPHEGSIPDPSNTSLQYEGTTYQDHFTIVNWEINNVFHRSYVLGEDFVWQYAYNNWGHVTDYYPSGNGQAYAVEIWNSSTYVYDLKYIIYGANFDATAFHQAFKSVDYDVDDLEFNKVLFAGDDDIEGSPYDDNLLGYAGNDKINGGTGADQMAGGVGNDIYVVDNVGDVVTEAASAGTDTVQSSVTHTLAANVEHLTLTGTAAINGTGNNLNNVLTGNSAANILTGGLGNDTYVIGVGDSVVEAASAGTDTVQSSVTHTLAANVEHLTLTGAAAINGTGNNLNNVLTGNSAANILTGGLGNDTYVIGVGDSVVEAASAGTDTVQSSVTHTLAANVEHLTLTGTAAINGTGNNLNNVLTGNSAANILTGGLGNDTYVIGVGDSVVEAASAGTDTVQSSVTHTLAANVEHLTLTGAAAINGTGNNLNNVLTGNSAANILTGGLGNDTYVIGVGDSVVEAASAGTDTVQSSVTHTLAANVEHLTLTGTAAINGTGNNLNNVLTGNSAANILTGGLGNDTYVIGVGDSVVEAASAGTDTVQSSVTHTLAANVEHLTLTGTAAINGTGNTLDNLLTGNSAANILNGGYGIDAVHYGNSTVAVTVDLWTGIASSTATGTDTLVSIEHVVTGFGNDHITGNSEANLLNGGDGNDSIKGGGGVDLLVGGNGSDDLNGGSEADELIGISTHTGDITLGLGSIDVLTGGTENDIFVLGNSMGVFYSDGVTTNAGRSDYAVVKDFTTGDKIQLKGSASNYLLKTSDTIGSLTGTGLYWKESVNEFIALIQGPSSGSLNLTTSQFQYIS